MERGKKVKIVEYLTVPLSMAFLFENIFSFSLKFATGITSLIVSWECRLLLDTMPAGYTVTNTIYKHVWNLEEKF